MDRLVREPGGVVIAASRPKGGFVSQFAFHSRALGLA